MFYRATVGASLSASLRCIGAFEPFQIAKAMHIFGMFIDQPAYDISVVTGFGQYNGGSHFAVAPVSSYIRMTHVDILDRLEVLYADYFTDHFGIQYFFQLAKVRGITKYVAYANNSSRFFCFG